MACYIIIIYCHDKYIFYWAFDLSNNLSKIWISQVYTMQVRNILLFKNYNMKYILGISSGVSK